MKRVFLKLVSSIIWIAVVFASCSNVTAKKGNGELVTSEKAVSTFEKIAFTGGFAEVRFYASKEYRAVVTVDSNLAEYVEVFTDKNVLNIKTKKTQSISPTKFTVDVYCPALSGFSLSGSGSFTGVDKIVSPTFAADISGSGKVNGTFECDNFSVRVSGSGDITAAGSANNTTIAISGSGNFNGNGFETKNASIQVSGSGDANIGVSDNLTANISGSGKITYRGEAKVESNVSGSGKIKKE